MLADGIDCCRADPYILLNGVIHGKLISGAVTFQSSRRECRTMLGEFLDSELCEEEISPELVDLGLAVQILPLQFMRGRARFRFSIIA